MVTLWMPGYLGSYVSDTIYAKISEKGKDSARFAANIILCQDTASTKEISGATDLQELR